MSDENQNPGHTRRKVENDGDGDKYFDSYRYTPYTTDLGFYRDPDIHESEVNRTTQEGEVDPRSLDRDKPRGLRRSDEQIMDEIESLLDQQGQVDASAIQVDVKDGIVTLSGNVGSSLEMRRVEGIVQNVLGVSDINNELTLRQ